MENQVKKLFGKLKTLFDAYKMWVFFTALLFGTNGVQMYVHSEPTSEELIKTVSTPEQKTTIIHKVDNEYCDKKLQEHESGAQH